MSKGDGSKKNSKTKKKNEKSKKQSKRKLNPLLAQLETKSDNKEEEIDVNLENFEDKDADEPKNDDALWADFLADTEEKPVVVNKPKKKSWAELLGTKKNKSSTSTSKGEAHFCSLQVDWWL